MDSFRFWCVRRAEPASKRANLVIRPRSFGESSNHARKKSGADDGDLTAVQIKDNKASDEDQDSEAE